MIQKIMFPPFKGPWKYRPKFKAGTGGGLGLDQIFFLTLGPKVRYWGGGMRVAVDIRGGGGDSFVNV